MKKKVIINDQSIEINLLDLQEEEVHFELEGERYKFNLQTENCGKIYLKDARDRNSVVFGFNLPLKSGTSSKKWHYISGGRDLFFEWEGEGKRKEKRPSRTYVVPDAWPGDQGIG